LNKRQGRSFTNEDREQAERYIGGLAYLVSDFIADPATLVSLGHAPRQDAITATIMFADISNFARLYQESDASVMTDIVNQYFEELGSAAIRHGASIDQYLGDGFMATFNVNQKLDDHGRRSVQAAAEVQETFETLKRRWETIGYAGISAIHNRIGIATGAVNKAEIGHWQQRRLTVLGPPVNTAAHLCNAGPRDRSSILVTEPLVANLGPALQAGPFGSKRPSEPPAFEIIRVTRTMS
jgi:adenylate cyclase